MDTGGGPLTIKRIIEDFSEFDHYVAGNEGVFMHGFRNMIGAEKVASLRGWRLHQNVILLVKLCRLHKIDVLHLHGRGAASFGRLVKLYLSVKVIYTPNGFYPMSLPWYFRMLYILGERLLLRLTDLVHFVSESEKLTFSKSLRLPNEHQKLVFVQNYLNLNKSDYEKVRPYKHTSYKKIKFLFIGRLSMQKGVDILVETIKILPYRDFHLTIIGYGEMEEYLVSMLDQYDLADNATYLGKVNEAFRLMPNFDALLLPSRFEGMPFTILEAMAYKLPIIATPCNGSVDLIKNGNGYLSVAITSNEFASSTMRFINDFNDNSDVIKNMVSNNYSRLLNEYSLSSVQKGIEALYS